jgi:hypothetical protein
VQAPSPGNPSLSPGKFSDFSRLHASSLSSGLDSDAPSPRDELEDEEGPRYGADLRRHGVEVALVSWVLVAVVVALCSNIAVGGEEQGGPGRDGQLRGKQRVGAATPCCPACFPGALALFDRLVRRGASRHIKQGGHRVPAALSACRCRLRDCCRHPTRPSLLAVTNNRLRSVPTIPSPPPSPPPPSPPR